MIRELNIFPPRTVNIGFRNLAKQFQIKFGICEICPLKEGREKIKEGYSLFNP